MRARRLLAVLPLLAALLALAGCFNVKQHLTINADGSAVVQNTITVDSSLLEAASQESGGEDLSTIFDDLAEQAEAEGFQVERIDEDGQSGIRATKQVEDVEDFDLAELGAGTTGEVSVRRALLKNTYSVDLTLPFDADEGGAGGLGTDAEGLIDAQFVLTLPGRIGETNGTLSDDGRTATWDLKVSEDNVIRASGSAYNTVAVAGLGGGGLALAGAAAVAAVLLLRRKASPRQAEGVESGAPPVGVAGPAPERAASTSMEPTGPPVASVPAPLSSYDEGLEVPDDSEDRG